MAVKNKAQVIIGGKVITVSGYESEEYLHQLASYMNRKITELSDLPGYSRLPMETRHNLLSLNITDDYFKAKRQAEDYEQNLSRKDQEMYDLKHELIDVRMKLDDALKAAQDAQEARLTLEGRVRELEAGLGAVRVVEAVKPVQKALEDVPQAVGSTDPAPLDAQDISAEIEELDAFESAQGSFEEP